ncbi:MAG: hypothetical protein V4621_00700 [Pseudomonadota bacterium]
MQDLIYPWLDALWLPVGLILVQPGQRLRTGLFIVLCMIGMRLQIEVAHDSALMGILGWLPLDAFQRSLIVYSFFIGMFLVLTIFSPQTRGPIFMAASLSIFFMAFFVTSVIMLL